jgi:hypothetical protein
MSHTLADPPKKKRSYAASGFPASPGSGPKGETCSSCANCVKLTHRGENFHKCAVLKARWTKSPKTDIRLAAPACELWQSKADASGGGLNYARDDASQEGADYDARLAEIRRDLRDAKIGKAEWLVIEVIFDYSFALRRADAWIPSLAVFVLRTGMRKKEIGEALGGLQSYGILEWDAAPDARFPWAQRYKVFPKHTRSWSISPRVANRRLQEKAADIDRWLCALNASGGPAQGDLFPDCWDHADTLAEWRPQSDDPHEVRPDRLPGAQPPEFQPASPFPANTGSLTSDPVPPQASPRPAENNAGFSLSSLLLGLGEPAQTVGKNPTPDRGEKPHAPSPLNAGIGVNERSLSHSTQTRSLNETVGKNPTPAEEAEVGDETRPEHWPPREVENRLMRRLADMFVAFYAPEMAKKMMEKFGGIWRWRIREWVLPVEQALDVATAQWKEIKKLGGFLNREWKKRWLTRAAKQQEALAKRSS